MKIQKEIRGTKVLSYSAEEKQKIIDQLAPADPKFIKKIHPFLKGLYDHYFRCEVSGFENVPKDSSLIISNHNGLITYEVLMLFHAWWSKFGPKRPGLGLAHDIAIKHPALKWLMPKLGAIPGDPEIAEKALQKGYDLLVFPGGLKEAFRPFYKKKFVEFYNRKGFIRVALRAKKPILPVVSIGANETFVILHRGEEIAEKLGIKQKFRFSGVPITFRSVFFMWCMVTGVFTFFPLLIAPFAFASIFVPMPAKMTFKFLPAIYPHQLYNDALSFEENVDQVYDLVTSQMQNALTEGYEQRKLPIIG